MCAFFMYVTNAVSAKKTTKNISFELDRAGFRAAATAAELAIFHPRLAWSITRKCRRYKREGATPLLRHAMLRSLLRTGRRNAKPYIANKNYQSRLGSQAFF